MAKVQRQVGANPQTQDPFKSLSTTQLLAEGTVRSHARFREYFNLFLSAFTHELRGGIIGLCCMRDLLHMQSPAADRLIRAHDRLSAMQRVLRNIDPSNFGDLEKSAFSAEEMAALKSENQIEVACELGLRTIQDYRDALSSSLGELSPHMSELHPKAAEALRKKITRIVVLAPPMLDHLEHLFTKCDFEPNLSSIAFSAPSWDSSPGDASLFATSFFRAADLNGCANPEYEITRTPALALDPFFMALILQNIFANASRAMESAGIKAKEQKIVRIWATVAQEESKVIFYFKDAGCGMTSDIMDKLNSGVQGAQVTTKENPSEENGTGFWYCAHLAKEMGGRLYVERSELGVGTTIAWEIPLAPKTE